MQGKVNDESITMEQGMLWLQSWTGFSKLGLEALYSGG